jgi:hemolysin activation/secretion protein
MKHISLSLAHKITTFVVIFFLLYVFSPSKAVQAATTASNALTAPNAGTLQQEIERDRELNRLRISPPPETQTKEIIKDSSGPSVTVKEFRFIGNSIYTSSELAERLTSYLNHPIDFKDLEAATLRVAEFYRQGGWVVKTSLPPQDIGGAIVTIQVVEAIFGQVRIDGKPSKNVDSTRILATFYTAQKPGSALNSKSIERALSLVGELSGLVAQGSLSEGEHEGETDLIVSLKDKSFFNADVGSDNSGSRSTGSNHLTANFNLNSPLKMGDQLGLNLISSLGSEYIRLSETIPVGYSGLKIGMNASILNYRLITQDFISLAANGTSTAVGLESNYPLIKSNSSLLNLAFNADYKHFVNNSQGAVVSDYRNSPLTLALSGYKSDSLLGGGYGVGSLNISTGGINLNNSPATYQSNDASTTQVSGRYTKTRYFLSREQDLFSSLTFYTAVSGQWANKNLDSSEKFYLGGVNGVRAYPTNEAGGALGELANLELRARFLGSYTMTGFYDFGQILINPTNNFTGASALNSYALKGAGLSLGYQSNSGANLKAVVAKRIGRNPNPTSSGNDQDGSLQTTRIWLNANLPF